MKAIWNGETIAESHQTIVVEGNHYFPPQSMRRDLLRQSRRLSICPWKGPARYYTIEVNGARNPGAAWYYPHPFPWIRKIKNHVAFWNGVDVRP